MSKLQYPDTIIVNLTQEHIDEAIELTDNVTKSFSRHCVLALAVKDAIKETDFKDEFQGIGGDGAIFFRQALSYYTPGARQVVEAFDFRRYKELKPASFTFTKK